MSVNSKDRSFVSMLLKKAAMVEGVAKQTGKDTSAASREVRRQIRQAAERDPVTGEGVTKSGKED